MVKQEKVLKKLTLNERNETACKPLSRKDICINPAAREKELKCRKFNSQRGPQTNPKKTPSSAEVKKTPHSSSRKPNNVFNFNFKVNPKIKANAETERFKNSRKQNYRSYEAPINRFGFRQTRKIVHSNNEITLGKATLKYNEKKHQGFNRNSKFNCNQAGLNINLSEATTGKSVACSSTELTGRKLSRGSQISSPNSPRKTRHFSQYDFKYRQPIRQRPHRSGTKRNVELFADPDNCDKIMLANDAKQRVSSYTRDLVDDHPNNMSEISLEMLGEQKEGLKGSEGMLPQNSLGKNSDEIASSNGSFLQNVTDNDFDCSICYDMHTGTMNSCGDECSSKISNEKFYENQQAISSGERHLGSKNSSSKSVVSVEQSGTGDSPNRKKQYSKLPLPVPSKTTVYSCNNDDDCPSLWSSNRSFFLRMTENRRKKHRQEWEREQRAVGFVTVPTVLQREKAVQDLQHDLTHAKKEIKSQERKISVLYEELVMSRTERKTKEEEEQIKMDKNNKSRERRKHKSRLWPRCPLEKDHGDQTLGRSITPEVYASIPALSSEPESVANGAGDVTLSPATKDYDQGYYSLPRRSDSFVVSNPQIPPEQLPIYFSPNESMLFFRDNIRSALSESSLLSNLTTPTEKAIVTYKTVGCQTDLLLFAEENGDFKNLLILLQSQQNSKLNPNSIKDTQLALRKKTPRNILIFDVLPHFIVLSAIWRNSRDNILDLQWVLDRFVLPAWRKWLK